jgi:hypothetical protein
MVSENPLSAALLRMLMPAGRLACLITPPLTGCFFECDVVKGGQARAEPLKLGAVLAIAAVKVLVAP